MLAAAGVATMIALINGARMSSGVGTVGWLTPLLYRNEADFTDDITNGMLMSCD